tara:strand:- start:824 stop:1600 length:777 start_codon:yes stop_codon:yes gene_type:complete
MKQTFLALIFFIFIGSCTTKKDLIYIEDHEKYFTSVIDSNLLENKIQVGDVLKIEVKTIVPEASIPYNSIVDLSSTAQNLDVLQLQGYLVDNSFMIKFPVLGSISTEHLNFLQLEMKIREMLLKGGHLSNAVVNVRRLNSKFTILGEVRNPGTFTYFDEKINIFQALGFAGDLTIFGKRNNIILIREIDGLRKIFDIKLTSSDLLNKQYYYIKTNDVIIVKPNYSKVKSSGFIGSASSIASISSLLVSLTLLILNNMK